MKTDCVAFGRLPQQNPLFLAYLAGGEGVGPWYPRLPVLTDSQLLEQARRALEAEHFERSRLVEVMAPIQELVGADASGRLLASLSEPDCVAVVTGQQVGLFGGPAYSVYKAVTAVLQARRLRKLGQAAVPVFWLASDDSDFDEVRSSFFAPDDELVELCYPIRPEEGCMAGPVSLSAIDELFSSAPQGLELNGVRRFYKPEADFRQAFGGWLADLFRDEGLLFFDPLADGFREAAANVFRTAIARRDDIVSRLLERNAEIEAAGFSPQVHVDESETLLFWVEQGRRHKLEFLDGRYRAKNRRELRWSPEQLLEQLSSDPERLGGNALLRPLLQEYLLPAAVTVGGPGEISYFGQLEAIAPLWDRRPVIVPRSALTIADRQVQRLLGKYGFEGADFLTNDPDAVTERLVHSLDAGAVLTEFDELRESLTRRLTALQSGLEQHDPTVAGMLENSSRKILYQIDKVKSRLVSNTSRTDQAVRRHLGILNSRLRPRGGLQERWLNFNQFLADDPHLIDRLLEQADPDARHHQILYL